MEVGKSLKEKTITGLFWSFTDQFASQGIQFFVLLILARLVSPEDFGLIGMVSIFIVISNTLIDCGLTQALIRERKVSQEEYSTIFFFNFVMASLLFIILYLIAPLVSTFFHDFRLVTILRVLSIGLLINSLGIIQRVILIRNINFRTQTKINFSAALCAGIIAIIFSLFGFGVWSIIIQSLIFQLAQTILLWKCNKWIPTWTFSYQSLQKFFWFGNKLLISNLIDTLYNNCYSIIIGRLYPAAQLGYYTNASKLGDVIINSTTSSLQRVTYPVLSTIQDEEKLLSEGFQKIIRITAYIMFPLMCGMIVISDSLIPLLLGPQWNDAIIYFQLIAFAGMIYPLHAVNLNILQVKGRSDLFLKLEVIKKILLTLLIAISLSFSLGILGLLGAAILSSYISLFINAYYSAKEISYSIWKQLKDILPLFLLSIFMGSFVFFIGVISPGNLIIKLIFQVISGCLLYASIGWMFKMKEFIVIYSLLFQLFNKVSRQNFKSKGA